MKITASLARFDVLGRFGLITTAQCVAVGLAYPNYDARTIRTLTVSEDQVNVMRAALGTKFDSAVKIEES